MRDELDLFEVLLAGQLLGGGNGKAEKALSFKIEENLNMPEMSATLEIEVNP